MINKFLVSFKAVPFFLIAVCIVALNSCDSSPEQIDKQKVNDDMDTLHISEIMSEIDHDIWSVIKLNYFDKNSTRIDGLNNDSDTFFMMIEYQSLKFNDLNNYHELEVEPISSNCSILKMSKNKFRLTIDIDSNVDTIEYKLYLCSDKYLFRETNFMSGKEVINDRISLGSFYEVW